ncbi:MAG: DUF6057 family protein, partial [Bacteroidales bacterium]|nr:DUF6057 family protein [Bacteroidales bacterium]
MKISLFNSDLKRVHQLVGIALFALFYVSLITISYEKLYWESVHFLFRFSAAYFREIFGEVITLIPGAFFVNGFLGQFLLFPYLGALIIVGLYALIYCPVKRLLVRVGYSAVFAHYFVLSVLVMLHWWVLSTFFTWHILTILAVFYSVVAGYFAIKHTFWKICFALGSLWILPLFGGVWSMGIGLFFIVDAVKRFNLKIALGVVVGVLISVLLPPYVWQHTIFIKNYTDILLAIPTHYVFVWKPSMLWFFSALPLIL